MKERMTQGNFKNMQYGHDSDKLQGHTIPSTWSKERISLECMQQIFLNCFLEKAKKKPQNIS